MTKYTNSTEKSLPKPAISSGSGGNMISRVATLYFLNVQFSAKTYETCRETRKYGPCSRGEKNRSIEIVPEEAQIWDLLDRDFISTILNVFKELKKTISKELKESMRRMPYQINRNYFS